MSAKSSKSKAPVKYVDKNLHLLDKKLVFTASLIVRRDKIFIRISSRNLLIASSDSIFSFFLFLRKCRSAAAIVIPFNSVVPLWSFLFESNFLGFTYRVVLVSKPHIIRILQYFAFFDWKMNPLKQSLYHRSNDSFFTSQFFPPKKSQV